MHLIPTIPGGWNPNDDGVFHIQQSAGDIVFLTAADTEIQSLSGAYRALQTAHSEVSLPSLRMANLVYLKQELTIDTYVEEVIAHAKLVICRLLGGRAYYPYLCEAIAETCAEKGIPLLFLPGYNAPDVELMSSSTAEPGLVDLVWKYCCAGGSENAANLLKCCFHRFFGLDFSWEPPIQIPELLLLDGVHWKPVEASDSDTRNLPVAAIIAYQSHYLADNLEPLKFLCTELSQRGMFPLLVFASNLRDPELVAELGRNLRDFAGQGTQVIINTTGFALRAMDAQEGDDFLFSTLNVPVIQAIHASCTRETWEQYQFGLTPVDVAMHVALPEMDGRIITTAISFKLSVGRDSLTDSDVLRYEPHPEGCVFVAAFAHRWILLQRKPAAEKRVALIMPNYPNKDSRLANGVGLDTPASVVEILRILQKEGYDTGSYIPSTTADLMKLITHFVTNDTDTLLERPYALALSHEKYLQFYNALSEELRSKVETQWGDPSQGTFLNGTEWIIPGVQLGNVFVSIQPSRGYNQDPKAVYHSPDLPPTHDYLAYYCWVQQEFGADAIVHTGKHGNLEWLPGKSLALSAESCFPAAILEPTPHFYPFIVNDPGEGSQAKRRTHAVILDHLIPPMTRAETYGDLARLEHLLDEYYEALHIDPKRLNGIRNQILQLVRKTHLDKDLGIAGKDTEEVLVRLDSYLCELKESQIRDGLHIFGKAPEGRQLVDLLVALHRLPVQGQMGITQALAKDFGLDFDPLHTSPETMLADPETGELRFRTLTTELGVETAYAPTRTIGDQIARLEELAAAAVQVVVSTRSVPELQTHPRLKEVLHVLHTKTLPLVLRTSDETGNLLRGLNGQFVPPGSSGAPTRGRLDVLPTGRNFYSVDVRTIPTETAYAIGSKSAALIIDRYIQENGDYPESVGISVWGTSTMRTGGDDIAQAFALMGVKPVWQQANRRVTDFEIIPLLKLGRPRVDVMLRISGFFRDAFPDVITLFNAAVEKLAELDEPEDQNPVRKRFLAEHNEWKSKGLDDTKARSRALFRVFGSKPGAYGAGLQAMIDERNWSSQEDLAKVYIQWSGYAYGKDRTGESAHEVFEKRLADTRIVIQNQDNREHDILDSDDYYQFQGGMAAAVQLTSGSQPSLFFGDHSRPENPKVRTLKEELLKVYRSRVVNPKWLEGVRRHGYKGAFEMAATMDYLFAYDATTGLVDDFMYEGITQEYLFDETNRNFIEQVNPWALRDMTERMLEAIQRGMWKSPDAETVTQLTQLLVNQES